MQWDYGKFILKQLDYSPSFHDNHAQPHPIIVYCIPYFELAGHKTEPESKYGDQALTLRLQL